MGIDNLQPASGSTKSRNIVGRGAGTGNGKTSGRGHKGQRSRTGFKNKRGFEGGQMPIQKRVPKVGFTSRVEKPVSINVDKETAIANLEEITLVTIKEVKKLKENVKAIKLIGSKAKELKDKIKDERITTSGSD